MFILLAVIAGAVVGAALHVALPLRPTRGVALGPMLSAALAAVTWAAATWAGLSPEGAWIWLPATLIPAAVTAATLLVVSRRRAAADERDRRRLRIA